MIDTIKNFCFGWFLGSAVAVIVFHFLGWDNQGPFVHGAAALVVAGAIQSYQELTKK